MLENGYWHSKLLSKILQELQTSEKGLSTAEAKRRIGVYGANELPENKVDGNIIIFLRQFKSPLIYVLLLVSIITFLMGEVIDSAIILAVLIFNAIIGSLQEGKAQNTLLALKKLAVTKATVLRDGKEVLVHDAELVPGDIIVLLEGERIPADARLITASGLKVNEATMTGESEAAHKTYDAQISENASLADKKNMVFKGTYVVAGNGIAVIVATGRNTVIGSIAVQISSIDVELPLNYNIRHLSRLIIVMFAALSSIIILFGLMNSHQMREVLLVVIALLVSIIPEGLPIVITVLLATSMWRLSKRNVLVKKLQAVGALGQTQVIAVDKTGTLTKNELVVSQLYVNETLFTVEGNGYEPHGSIRQGNETVNSLEYPGLAVAAKIAALCANAKISPSAGGNGQFCIAGDPTEAAMLVFAEKLGLFKKTLDVDWPFQHELPFDYVLRYHAVIYGKTGAEFLALVGAPETIIERCSMVWHNGVQKPFLESEKIATSEIFIKMASQGLRIIACAEGPCDSLEPNQVLTTGLTFIGFFGIKDALRPEVGQAMASVNTAGMRVVMITGDHKVTAEAIGREAGIFHDGDQLLTGEEIEAFSEQQLVEKISMTSVFARVSPEHKLKIINAFKAGGDVIAMTGDGVNDAPSLVAADLGVAMGKIGTEVAKEAADLVLLDDNFGNIVVAIEEGRNILINIKRVLLYLFAGSASIVFTILGTMFLSYPLPLFASQIIWINFITDGFLDISLAMEPSHSAILGRSYKKPTKYLFDWLMVQRLLLHACILGSGTLFLFNKWYAHDLHKARTIALTTLVIGHLLNAWNCRSERKSLFLLNPLSNQFIAGASVLIIGLQLFAIYNPFMQKFLRTVPLEISDWQAILMIASSVIIVEETRKFLYQWSKRRG